MAAPDSDLVLIVARVWRTNEGKTLVGQVRVFEKAGELTSDSKFVGERELFQRISDALNRTEGSAIVETTISQSETHDHNGGQS
jgi:uncharacterized protein YkuJ